VFLGLLGTFWADRKTVVLGKVIQSLEIRSCETSAI